MDGTPVSSFSRRIAWCYALFLGTYLLYWALYVASPDGHSRHVQGEDRAVEWLTFAGFAGAMLAAFSILRWRSHMDRRGVGYFLGLAMFCLLCAGEEISWGQRLFGFDTPPAVSSANEQQEFNLHNLRLEHIHPKSLVSWSIKCFGVIAPLLCLCRRRRPNPPADRYLPPLSLAPCFLFSDVIGATERSVAGWVAGRVDEATARFVTTHVGAMSEELQEMYLGWSMLLAMLLIRAAWSRREVHAGGDSTVRDFPARSLRLRVCLPRRPRRGADPS